MPRTLIADISRYQDAASTPYKPELNKMKDAGIFGAIIKCSENLFFDSSFEYYWQECETHNIPRMIYSFLDYWGGSADSVNQGKFLADWFKSRNIKNVRAWLDFERPNANFPELPPRKNCLDMIGNWLNSVDDGLETESGIYLNLSTIEYLSPIPDWLAKRPFWLAWPPSIPSGKDAIQYTQNMNPPSTVFNNLKVWQFNWTGPGLQAGFESKGLDIDWWMGDIDDLNSFSGLVVPPPVIIEPPPIIVPPVDNTVKDQLKALMLELADLVEKF
jgi:GH25 family lysozyme M1 (1,4-beta-N-acetylmuramidase)